ncbi:MULTISPECIES: hypothetical protein [unclassified Burkholderia]|uniref:hypothetical protein n=1 Tax=unclassified Burkholderia TaxID=2613784 RepID=UPI00075BD67E|nr:MULTISPECIES: hypothetical protein [unclassified Burkholderia]KVN13281.1 hypothetical protein WT08_10475 [Burkholderia sp. MSMB1552]KWZ56742.1 hypothetical protein WS92_13160 [Burkholderia sp. MSMB1588]
MNNGQQINLKVAHVNVAAPRENLVNAIGVIMGEAHDRSRGQRQHDFDFEDDVNIATRALKAVSGLCVSGDRPGSYHLDHVKGDQLVALLDLITDRLERSAR